MIETETGTGIVVDLVVETEIEILVEIKTGIAVIGGEAVMVTERQGHLIEAVIDIGDGEIEVENEIKAETGITVENGAVVVTEVEIETIAATEAEIEAGAKTAVVIETVVEVKVGIVIVVEMVGVIVVGSELKVATKIVKAKIKSRTEIVIQSGKKDRVITRKKMIKS